MCVCLCDRERKWKTDSVSRAYLHSGAALRWAVCAHRHHWRTWNSCVELRNPLSSKVLSTWIVETKSFDNKLIYWSIFFLCEWFMYPLIATQGFFPVAAFVSESCFDWFDLLWQHFGNTVWAVKRRLCLPAELTFIRAPLKLEWIMSEGSGGALFLPQ